jgi:hypothetical protein
MEFGTMKNGTVRRLSSELPVSVFDKVKCPCRFTSPYVATNVYKAEAVAT